MRKIIAFILLLFAFTTKAQEITFNLINEYEIDGQSYTTNYTTIVDLESMTVHIWPMKYKIYEARLEDFIGNGDAIFIFLKISKNGTLPTANDVRIIENGDYWGFSFSNDKSTADWLLISPLMAVLKEDNIHTSLDPKDGEEQQTAKYEKLVSAIRKRQGNNGQTKQPVKPKLQSKQSKPATQPNQNLTAMLEKPMKVIDCKMSNLYPSIKEQNAKYGFSPEIAYDDGAILTYRNLGEGFEVAGVKPLTMRMRLDYDYYTWDYDFKPGNDEACKKLVDIMVENLKLMGYTPERASYSTADADHYVVHFTGGNYTVTYRHDKFSRYVTLGCTKNVPSIFKAIYLAEYKFSFTPSQLFDRPFAASEGYAKSFEGLIDWVITNRFQDISYYSSLKKIIALCGTTERKGRLHIDVKLDGSEYFEFVVNSEEYELTDSGYRFEIKLTLEKKKDKELRFFDYKEKFKESKQLFDAMLAQFKPSVQSLRKDKDKTEIPQGCSEMWSAVKGDRIYYFCLLKSGDVVLKEIKN